MLCRPTYPPPDLRSSYVPEDPSQVVFCPCFNWGYVWSTTCVSTRTPSWNTNSITLEIYRQRHDHHAKCVIAQQDSPTNFPLRFNPLNDESNPICHLLALLGAHHILHVSRIRVNSGKEKSAAEFRNIIWFTTFLKLCKSQTAYVGSAWGGNVCLITFLSYLLVTAIVYDVCPTCNITSFVAAASKFFLPFAQPLIRVCGNTIAVSAVLARRSKRVPPLVYHTHTWRQKTTFVS